MSPEKQDRQPCEVYSRVVGWLTPVKNWNKGKRAEYRDRKTFKTGNDLNS
ncbi:MAG TPA: anaerobic ribonucleoside-triphosphate reductase [Patescibacteria group bacterium]|nr:anaerobic ribonucleoside-triphosphate reductase [Patescibacteria group bacterium]